ncbi:uncharacterized protein EAF02_011341 [Botrytis sinoallii]|uniref:uncharacterized protein n=1 Tax=Botrytis sinoallii TaxID=1463999 RepID=UPI001901ACCB|nr:uncharacterized protein EAF02_011341 [Botrytis sinoallii]KAF7857108.1 hypothetical protein EAF02_011341 [Botrytis sinoallii]
MRPSTILSSVALGLFATVQASTNATLDALVENANANLLEILQSRVGNPSETCTSENVLVRREWGALSSTEKKEYIAAVQCMTKLPPITPLSVVPGVRSRHDDFGASIFLAWHRYYTWAYETALRDECGYNGTQPYWDWSSTDTIAAHPLFDGSDTSIGGNGAYVEGYTDFIILPTPVIVNVSGAAGTGGGCITDGPFSFSNYMGASTGLQSNGHTATGGLQDDLWVSAQDPSFVFHHAQVDRVWTLWAAQNQTVRTKEVSDTLTIKNEPPSANGTLDTTLGLGYNGGTKTIGELSSTINGIFCYIYA